MQLVVLNRFHNWPDDTQREYPHVTLRPDSWDDYGFKTSFEVSLYLDEDFRIDLGMVKIGRADMTTSDLSMRAELKGVLPSLSDNYFSLGQEVDYYSKLETIDEHIRGQFAAVMRDIPILGLNREELERYEVFRISLIRFNSAIEALEAGSRIFANHEAPSVDQFSFSGQLGKAIAPHVVPFDFQDDSGLPHRINVLVGGNGVGKTQLLARLAVLLSRFEDKKTVASRKASGETFEVLGSLTPRPSIYGVVAVSFSAFDDFDIPTAAESDDFQYVYCGLRLPDGSIADKKVLGRRIASSIRAMDDSQRTILEIALDAVLPDRKQRLPTSIWTYNRLSAGQRIVLNIICEVIRNMRTRTLILLDEPETHLHPQLLTTLISVINDLLDTFDSFAIIATHSPIAVQQVLAKRVHIIRRIAENLPAVTHPPMETFGANLSDITREVFDAAESDRDYRDAIDQLLAAHDGDAAAVERLFPNGLGLSARIYLTSRARAVDSNIDGVGDGGEEAP